MTVPIFISKVWTVLCLCLLYFTRERKCFFLSGLFVIFLKMIFAFFPVVSLSFGHNFTGSSNTGFRRRFYRTKTRKIMLKHGSTDDSVDFFVYVSTDLSTDLRVIVSTRLGLVCGRRENAIKNDIRVLRIDVAQKNAYDEIQYRRYFARSREAE